ncbi:MAG TPA: hypothetical protein VFZ38_00470 [Vicinamibacterales bacterium]
MATRPVESIHEAEPNRPLPDPNDAAVESPSGDRMQGANGAPNDKAALPNTNEDDATSGDQDIDTAGTAHDDLSPTKSM